MKLLTLLLTIFLFSCNNNSGYRTSSNDTIFPVIGYNRGDGLIRFDIVRRVGMDSMYDVQVDSLTKKKQLGRIYQYQIFADVAEVDSLGKVIVLPDGKNKMVKKEFLIYSNENVVVYDGGVNTDSIQKKYALKPKK